MYPIGDDEALYAKDVPVILSSEATGYRPLCSKFSFIACPGVRMPRLTADGRLSPVDEERLRRKVRLIFATARDEVVCGALGCGVWGCPPRHVAEVFKSELDGEMRVIFASVMNQRSATSWRTTSQ